jgi:hypothetical protein
VVDGINALLMRTSRDDIHWLEKFLAAKAN